jgi:hypothetical protein
VSAFSDLGGPRSAREGAPLRYTAPMDLGESLLHALRDHDARQVLDISGDLAPPVFRVLEGWGVLPPDRKELIP